jgi:hypothetical protein
MQRLQQSEQMLAEERRSAVLQRETNAALEREAKAARELAGAPLAKD